MRVLDHDQRPRLEFSAALREHRGEMAVHGLSAFVGEPKEDDARLVEDPECEDVAEVEIECQDNARISPSAVDEFEIRRTLQPQRTNVNSVVPKSVQELNGDALGRRLVHVGLAIVLDGACDMECDATPSTGSDRWWFRAIDRVGEIRGNAPGALLLTGGL